MRQGRGGEKKEGKGKMLGKGNARRKDIKIVQGKKGRKVMKRKNKRETC